MLEKKGTLLDHETIEIVDQALDILQNFDSDGNIQNQDAWQLAHGLLTRLRAFLSSANTAIKNAAIALLRRNTIIYRVGMAQCTAP
jgi:hypothetical protein